MYLRMKATHYWGISKTGRYNSKAPVLPGCYKEHERRALNAKAKTLSKAEMDKQVEAIYTGSKGRRLTTPVLLTVHLHHGDMVIMHGAEMQKYYEVCLYCNVPQITITKITSPSSTQSCLRTSFVSP